MAAFATVILVLFSALAAVGEKQVDYLFVLCIFLALLALWCCFLLEHYVVWSFIPMCHGI